MSYNTQNFQSGQVLTAEALNTMDNLIQANEQAVQGINDTLSNIDTRTQEINNTSNNIYNYLQNDIWSKLSEIQNNINNSGGGTTSGGIEEQFQQLGYAMPDILAQAVQEGVNLKNSHMPGNTWLSLAGPTFMPSGLDLSSVEGVNPSEFILSWIAGYDMPNYNQDRLELRNTIGAVNIGNMGTTPKMILFGPLTTTVSFNAPIYFKNDFDGQMCLFNSCYSLTDVFGLEHVDVSNAQSLSFAFSGVTKLLGIDGYQNWNTSGVTSMQGMFNGVNFNSLDLANWDFSNVYNYNHMFGSCWNLYDLKLSGNFGCSAQDAQNLFSNLPLSDIVISNFNPNVISASNMFENCYNLNTLSLPEHFLQSTGDIWGLFNQCWALQTINGSIDVGCVSPDVWADSGCIFINDFAGSRYNQIRYLVLHNIGKYDDGMERVVDIYAPYWGVDNRQCVVDSLVNYSFDRKSNGYSNLGINLRITSGSTLSFTEEELLTASNKGIIINVIKDLPNNETE